MKNSIKLAFVILIATSLILTSTNILANSHPLDAKSKKSKENKVRDAIVKKLGKTVEGCYSCINIMTLTKTGGNNSVVWWNTTKPNPNPPTPPVCLPNEHIENNKCVPNPNPPNPNSTNFTKVIFVGDIEGVSVRNAVAARNPDVVMGLGDLTYQSVLDNFKTGWYDYFTAKGVVVKCVVGNHDADEESKGARIVTQALGLCGDAWYLKVGHVLFLGFNTNGNIQNQIDSMKSKVLNNSTIMNGIKHVVGVSHKNGHVPQNSKHPVEAAALYKALEQLIPDVYEVTAHNHVLAKAANGLWFITGGGVRSHYSCPATKDPIWPFCNNKSFGFLEFDIDNTGNILPAFYGTDGTKLN